MRLAIVLTFIAVWIVGFIIFSYVIPNEGFSLLAVLLGFALAYGVTALLERYLKTRWPSGRVVQVDKDGVKILYKSKQQHEMLSEDPVNTHFWTFKISKRARVPKGWSMLACALEYENEYLTVYTFMSPNQLSTLESADDFKKLIAKRKGKSQDDARVPDHEPPARLAVRSGDSVGFAAGQAWRGQGGQRRALRRNQAGGLPRT